MILFQSLNQSDIYGALPQVLYKVDKWRINYDDVSFKDIIGEGAFGIVWQAKIGERTVACKLLKGENFNSNERFQFDKAGSWLKIKNRMIQGFWV